MIASILAPEALIGGVLPAFGLNDVGVFKFHAVGLNHTYWIKTGGGRTRYLGAYRKP